MKPSLIWNSFIYYTENTIRSGCGIFSIIFFDLPTLPRLGDAFKWRWTSDESFKVCFELIGSVIPFFQTIVLLILFACVIVPLFTHTSYSLLTLNIQLLENHFEFCSLFILLPALSFSLFLALLSCLSALPLNTEYARLWYLNDDI